ncbi:MAG: PQQ-dependent sugar dehydrogenase [Thermoanaerobaculia bacterium]|nr:PQQ-dependent sugar dehydrogenase [Thermoanaerobaculia bacterium]
MKFLVVLFTLLSATAGLSATLPGFRAEKVGTIEGFPTALAIDSAGNLYYSSTAGTIYRFDSGANVPVASVTTHGEGNAGLLGLALIDDSIAAVHYTTINQTHDVIARIDLTTGTETVLHRFAADIEVPERGSSTEHHGGNITVAPDGSIFAGIGDYGGYIVAQLENWNGGKIFRIAPDGTATQWARGLRNPFDLAWDEKHQRVIVADNGPTAADELHIFTRGANLGWPMTWGKQPPAEGTQVPDYVFPKTVAPTGLLLLNGRDATLRDGILLGSFVTRAIYYFSDLEARPLAEPIALIEKETGFVIDVAQRLDGAIYFVTGSFTEPGAIYRLATPLAGDCNGDGVRSSADLDALSLELRDGAAQKTTSAQNGTYRGSWGCDANRDGMIGADDAVALIDLLRPRVRGVRGTRP